MSDSTVTETGTETETDVNNSAEVEELRKNSVNPRDAILAQIAARGHTPVDGELQPFDEETGQVIQNSAPEEPKTTAPEQQRDEQGRFVKTEATQEAPAPEAPTTEATPEAPRKVKVKVYGEEREVDEQELIAGYQITAAARRQLEAANAAKRQYEMALARIGQTVQAAPDQQQGSAELPADQLAAQGRSPAIPTPAQISALVRHEVTQSAAVDAFKRDFADIANDPYLYRVAIAREDERLWRVQQGVEPDKPLGDALREHGEAIRSWLRKHATPAPQTTQKLQAKAAAAAPVVGSALRAPAPEPTKPKTHADLIAEARKARGQAS